ECWHGVLRRLGAQKRCGGGREQRLVPVRAGDAAAAVKPHAVQRCSLKEHVSYQSDLRKVIRPQLLGKSLFMTRTEVRSRPDSVGATAGEFGDVPGSPGPRRPVAVLA